MAAFIVASQDFVKPLHKYGKKSKKINTLALLITITVLAALYYLWNIALVIAVLMMMAARIPDLIWEIKRGRKLRTRDMRRPAFWALSTILSWASLPVVWYGLYRV